MSDSDRIRAEVERRKQQARQLGLPEQVTQFYRNLARFYPAWKENRPELVPESLTDIRAEGKDSVEFLYSGDRYSLTWSEQSIDLPDGDVHFSGALKLLVNGNQVFEVYLHGDFNEYTGTEWRPSDVRAFIEGPWVVVPFKTFASEGERLHALYLKRAEEDRHRREAAELKERFGIVSEEAKHREGDLGARVVAETPKGSSDTLADRLRRWLTRLLRGGER